MPHSWRDLSQIATDFRSDLIPGVDLLVSGTLSGRPTILRDRRGHKLIGELRDGRRTVLPFTAVRACHPLEASLSIAIGGEVTLFGRVVALDGQLGLFDVEIPDASWLGALMPRYPHIPRLMSGEAVRERVLALFPTAVQEAAHWLSSELRPVDREVDQLLSRINIIDTFWAAHMPVGRDAGTEAQAMIMALLYAWRIAAELGLARPLPVPDSDTDDELRSLYGDHLRVERDRFWMFARTIGPSDLLKAAGA